MSNKKYQGVGVPTGLESIGQSNPGFNQGVRQGEFIQPDAALRYSRKQVSTINIDLSVAQIDVKRNIAGTFLYYGSAINSANEALINRPITVRFDRISDDGVQLLPGMMLSGFPFDRLFITVPSGYAAGDVGQLIVTIDTPDDRVRAE
jgi:hypothetical protein